MVDRGLRVSEVIAVIAEVAGQRLNCMTFDGAAIDLEDPFDDYGFSPDAAFIFSMKGSGANSASASQGPASNSTPTVNVPCGLDQGL